MNGTGLQGFTKNNLTKSIRSAGILRAIPLLCASLMAQQKKSSGAVEGQRIFTGNCAACHGLDGGGGERGPDIEHRREIQRRTDQELFRTVHDGIPTAGMPSFKGLGTPAIEAVIKYLRQLQNQVKVEPLPGDPKNGQLLFGQKGAGSSCPIG